MGITGVSITFLISDQKHKIWVIGHNGLIEAVLTSPTIYVWGKSKANITIFHPKYFGLRAMKESYILHRFVNVMSF